MILMNFFFSCLLLHGSKQINALFCNSFREKIILRDRIPVMLFLSLQRMNYPLRQQTASRNENGKGGRRTKMARGAEEVKKKEKKEKSFVLQPTTMPVMQGSFSQTIVKPMHNGLQFIAFIIPPSK